MPRDRQLERGLLERAQQHADLPRSDWAARVLARVDAHGAIVGRDLPDHLSVDEILRELQEEGLDLGGWAIMAVQVADGRLSEQELELLRENLELVGALGCLADRLLGDMRTFLAGRASRRDNEETPG